jgi:hypothetical protein
MGKNLVVERKEYGMKLLKWLLIGGAIAWIWNRMRGRQPEALPASTPEAPSTPQSL